jgi:hypothetical protein
VTAKLQKLIAVFGVVAMSAALAGCGGAFARDSKAPARLVIVSLQGASGAEPEEMGSFVLSDVITNVTTGGTCTADNPCPSRFNDIGHRYRVQYRRSDGRNTPGVDVPYDIDGAATATVPLDGTATFGFQLVRNAAKREAPLVGLADSNDTLITVIATVTFWGRDQAGNEVSVSGSIDITFGNFGDPA